MTETTILEGCMPALNEESAKESEEVKAADTEAVEVAAEPATGNDATDGPDWKALSRKHEDREKAANAKLEKLRASYDEQASALVSARRETAILRAQKANPALTDEMFEFCTETDPDAIAQWAERAVKTFGVGTGKVSAEPKVEVKEPEEPYGQSQHLSEKLARSDNSAGKPADPTSLQAAYERVMKKQKAKQVNK